MINLGIKEDVERLAEQLGETQKIPLQQIALAIEFCGVEFVELMVQNSITLEENGGLMTADGKRRRSLGGVFFYLVRYALPYDLRRLIFPPPGHTIRRVGTSRYKIPSFDWEKRGQYLKNAFRREGIVQHVNIRLEGRPGNIEHRDDVFIVTMQQRISDSRTFPRGVPQPPEEPTRYVAYIGAKQWRKHVKNELKEDENAILELLGACFYDDEVGAMSVLVESIKIGKLKPKPKPEPPTEPPAEEKKPSAAPPPVEQEKSEEEQRLEGLSEDLSKKLRALYGARRMFEKRLADVQAQPEDKQKGLKAAQLMLDRTEKQIAALEKAIDDKHS